RVYLYLGGVDGLALSLEITNPDDEVQAASTGFGYDFAGLGDLDGDQVDDLAISAEDGGAPGNGNFAPRVRVYSGVSGGLPSTTPSATLSSGQNQNYNDFFGLPLGGID